METRLAAGTRSLSSIADVQVVVGCYRLNSAPDTPIHFSHFSGSAWRGALGHALARLACTHEVGGCPPCQRTGNGAYELASLPSLHTRRAQDTLSATTQ